MVRIFKIFALWILILILFFPIYYAHGSPSIGIGVYRGRGIPIDVKVQILYGNGSIYIEGIGYDELFKYSTYTAVYEAMLTLGLDPYKFDYIVYIKPREGIKTYLAGPSLSIAIYLATISTYLDINLGEDTVYTGSINPDLTVGFVGYIEEKAWGASNHGLKTFFMPAGEHYKYQIDKKPLRVGPYIFESYAVEKIPYNFTGIDLDLRELYNSFTPIDRHLNKINISDTSNMESEHLQYVRERVENYVYNILEMTRKRVNDVKRLLDESNIKVVNPQSYRYVIKVLGYTGDNLSISEYLLKKGYLYMSFEHSLKAYETVSKAFFLTVMLTMPDDRIDIINDDFYRLRNRVVSIINASFSNGVDEVSIVYKSHSARFYIEGIREARLALSGLRFFQVEPYVLSELSISLAEEMAKAVHKLLKAEAFSYISMRYGDPKLDISIVADKIYRYTDTLFKYVYRYSQETKVSSNLISLGGYSLDRARKGGYTEYPQNINELARISYLADSLSNLTLYMALHPGFEEIYRLRYDAILNSLSILLGYIQPDWLIIDKIKTSIFFEEYPMKIRLLEEAVTNAKVKLFLKGIVNIRGDVDLALDDSIFSTSTEYDGKPLYFEYLPIVGVSVVIILSISIYILKRRGGS